MNRQKKLKLLKLLKVAKQLLTILEELEKLQKLQNKRKRLYCVRPINRDRKQNGFFEVTFLKMKETDHKQFFIYTRMSPSVYELLLSLLQPFMVKYCIREAISPECRLAVTLLYLSQGPSLQSLACSFKLGKETVRSIILETTELIWSKLFHVYVSEPNEEDYKQISKEFWHMWNMPNCIGALDGKHIAIQCPRNSGSQLFCNKNFFSIVLLAVCDAKYKFTNVDVGAYGSQIDRGILQASKFGKKLLNHTLPIPPPECLPNTEIKLPHFLVADAAFPLTTNLMRPYPGVLLPKKKEIFNKRLSRSTRVIENAFGILVSRWRVLLGTLRMNPENAEKVILACVALHNFILSNDAATYIPNWFDDWEDSSGEAYDGLWRQEVVNNLQSISASANTHHYGGRSSTEIRNRLSDFFTPFTD